MSKTISSRELAEHAGISVQHLHWLVRKGKARPQKPARKQGVAAEWAEDDVALFSRWARLRRALAVIGRRSIAPIRLRALGEARGFIVIGKDDLVTEVSSDTTIGQLVRMIGDSFAVLTDE